MKTEKFSAQSFVDNPAWHALATELEGKAPGGELSVQTLAQEAAKSDPGRKAMLFEMLRSLQGPKQQPAGVFNSQAALRTGAVDVPTTKKVDEETARFRSFLDTKIIEQEDAKDVAARFYKVATSKLKLQKKPLVKLFAGPPGVGKTLMSKAEAEAIHGNPKAMIFIDCAAISDMTKLGKIVGIGRGYAGWDQECLFSPEFIAKTFGDKRPIIIHIDEPDKMPQEVAAKFWNVFNNFFQSGRIELDNEVLELGGQVIVNIATNSGHDKAKHLQGDARRKAYRDEASAALATHTDSRIDYICAFDPLSEEARKKIAKIEIQSIFNTAMEESAKLGKVVAIEPPAPDLCDLVARLAANDDYGARPVASMVSQVLNGVIDDVISDAADEQKFAVNLSAPIEGEALARIEKAFKDNKGRLPPGFDASDFNIQMVLKNPPPQLYDYNGQIPANPWGGEMRMMGSGVVGGRSFMMYNRDDFVSNNELLILNPGVHAEEDTFNKVKLPPELEMAHFVYSTPIDEPKNEQGEAVGNKRVMFIGISLPDDDTAKKPKITAHIWEPEREAIDGDEDHSPWKAVKAPPYALGDASFGSVGGQVLMWGGRRIVKDQFDGTWTTPSGTKGSVGKRIENQGYVYDPVKNDWDVTANAPRTPRCRAATVKQGEHLHIIGGEMTATNPQGSTFSKASAEVDIYDPVKKEFRPGTDMRSGIAFAGAYRDDFSRIRLVGGAELMENGFLLYERSGILSLDPRLERPAWKDRGDLGLLGKNLTAIPHPKGGVIIGPFYDGGEIKWKLEKAPEMVVKG
jgi:hypothetical protein